MDRPWGRGLLLIFALMIIWQAEWVPGPGAVTAALGRLLGSGELPLAVLISGRRLLLAYLAATLPGILLGVAMARSRQFAAISDPVVMGLQALPPICWYPLALLWFGPGEGAILYVTAIGTLLSVASATEGAIRSIPPALPRAAATMGARGWPLYQRVILPAALPQWLAGMRAGWSLAWRTLIAVEMLSLSRGLGPLLGTAPEAIDAARVIAVMLVILALGVAGDLLLFARAERAVQRRWGVQHRS